MREYKRIKRGYGLRPIRTKRELKALIEFCKFELSEEYIKLNPMRKWVFETTIKLNDWDIEGMTEKESKKFIDSILKSKNNVNKVMYLDVCQFIEDHVGWYWS